MQETRDSLTHRILGEVLATLRKLVEAITRGGPDNRRWEPDDSCKPFHFEAGIVGTGHSYLGEIRVPANMILVLRSVTTQGGNVTKAIKRIVITDQEVLAAKSTCVDGIPVLPMNGQVPVFECSPSTTAQTAGLAVWPTAVTRPFNMELDGGRTYYVYVIGTADAGPVNTAFIALSGYSYAGTPRV
jgi:hypothetical protein